MPSASIPYPPPSPCPPVLQTLRTSLTSYLIPSGETSLDYLGFQSFDTLQAACSYLRSILATSSVLSVSTDPSTVVAYRWAFNQGVGMFVSLFLNPFVPYFSTSIKQSRLLADVLNDVALTIEITLPYVPPSTVVFLMLVATTMKCMCGFIAGATRAAITSHFALSSNEADVAVKEGNQENLVTVVGLALGGMFLACFSSSTSILVAFFVLTFLHLVFNYIAIYSLRLRRLSFQRFHIAVAIWRGCKTPNSRLVNEGERLFYREPRGVGGKNKVEDYFNREGVVEGTQSRGYFVSRDRVFFRRGVCRARGYFHFLMMRGEFQRRWEEVFQEDAKDNVRNHPKGDYYLALVDLGLEHFQRMLAVDEEDVDEVDELFYDFVEQMKVQGWDVVADMGVETDGYLERRVEEAKGQNKKARSRSKGPAKRRSNSRMR